MLEHMCGSARGDWQVGVFCQVEGGKELGRWLVVRRGGMGRAGGPAGLGGLIGCVDGHVLSVCGTEVVFTEDCVFEGVGVGDVAVRGVVQLAWVLVR